MDAADSQHLAWIARSFGRADYLPLSRDDLRTISVAGEVLGYRLGTHLFREGAPADAAFVVKAGEVELSRGKGGGRRVVARIGPGAVIGDIAMFRGVPYFSSAKAVEAVVAFRFHRDRLLPELGRHPAVCLRWLVAALNQLEKTQRHILHLMHKTVRAQVAELLLDEADGRGEVRLSQDAMAMLLGTSRQSVNEALSELRSQKVLVTGYRFVKVLDPQTLGESAEGRGG